MPDLLSKEKRTIPRRAQTAFNYYRSIRRKIETLQIRAGETESRKILTMATSGRGRREIAARVVRESDWNLIMAIICTAWSASPESSSERELLISDAVQKLSSHLERRRVRRN